MLALSIKGWELHFLHSMDYRYRVQNGLPATVGIYEDVSGTGGYDRTANGSKVYTTVKVSQVTRQARNGGGPVQYDSTVEFYVLDPTYLAF